MELTNVIALLSGVALFLFGMLLMGDGLKKVAGNKLEIILYRLSDTPFKGVLLGTGVTAVIQSSSATSVMVVGFVNSGMMKVRQAIGIVLGAILGTSVTGWIICLSDVGGDSEWLTLLSTATLTGVIAVAGIILRMFCKKKIHNRVGNILMGFAILMTGMSAMSAAVSPLRESPAFVDALTSFSNPALGILAGLLLTCILQSASATVGILQALSMTGAITFDIAFPVIMGIAVGAAVPVLLSALGAGVNGKRTAFVYLFIDVIGAVVWAIVFYAANAVFRFPIMGMTVGMVEIAAINTLFRLATVVLLIPFIPLLEKLVNSVFREDPADLKETAEIDSLEDRFLIHPAIALEQSKTAVCSMAQKAQANLERSFGLLHDFSEAGYDTVQKKEEIVDRYEDKLGTYLVKLTGSDLSAAQGREISKILHTISDFERIGDHAVNLSDVAKEIFEKKLVFTEEAQRELGVLADATREIVALTTDAFVNEDTGKAARVEPLEEIIDNLCDEIKIRHVKRVCAGDCTLSQGFVLNDLLTNYERLSDHCSNIAVAMIELERDLFDTHEYLNEVKANRSEQFTQAYNEYDERFSLGQE